jgi:hypothetical protein
MNKPKPVSFFMDPQTRQLLRALAKITDMSMSRLIRQLVKKEAIRLGLILPILE